MSESKVEYRLICEDISLSGLFKYQERVGELFNQGFIMRGNSFVSEGRIYGELSKYPEGYFPPMSTVSRPMGTMVAPSQGFTLPPPIQALTQIGPEGQEIMTRIIKCYNSPRFREMLEEMGADFLDPEENTALTDSELSKLVDDIDRGN